MPRLAAAVLLTVLAASQADAQTHSASTTPPAGPSAAATGSRGAAAYGAMPFIVAPPPPVSPDPGSEGLVTEEGDLIAPADVDGRFTPGQLEAARRAAAADAVDGILRSAPPAIGIGPGGQGAVVSGTSIR